MLHLVGDLLAATGACIVCRPQRNPSHLFEETDITAGEDSKAGPTQDLLDMQSLPDVP